MTTSWDRWALEMCALISTRSKDPSTRVGALILRPDRTIASCGFNGFARGCDDSPSLYEAKPLKLARMIHAELNAILSAKEPLSGYTLYVSPFSPCSHCAAAIIQSGITRVVVGQDERIRPNWMESIIEGNQMFREAGVAKEVIHLNHLADLTNIKEDPCDERN